MAIGITIGINNESIAYQRESNVKIGKRRRVSVMKINGKAKAANKSVRACAISAAASRSCLCLTRRALSASTRARQRRQKQK